MSVLSQKWSLEGAVRSGLGRGAEFTQLDWVREQFVGAAGVDPHPGTLNLAIDSTGAEENWQRLRQCWF